LRVVLIAPATDSVMAMQPWYALHGRWIDVQTNTMVRVPVEGLWRQVKPAARLATPRGSAPPT